MTAYRSKAPLTLVRRKGGQTEYVYQHGLAPEDAVAGEIDRLVEEGYLEEADDVEERPDEQHLFRQEPPPLSPGQVELARAGVVPSPEPAGEPASGRQPAQNAPKAEWVEYAVTQGSDRAAAEASSKEQLVGRFGKR